MERCARAALAGWGLPHSRGAQRGTGWAKQSVFPHALTVAVVLGQVGRQRRLRLFAPASLFEGREGETVEGCQRGAGSADGGGGGGRGVSRGSPWPRLLQSGSGGLSGTSTPCVKSVHFTSANRGAAGKESRRGEAPPGAGARGCRSPPRPGLPAGVAGSRPTAARGALTHPPAGR